MITSLISNLTFLIEPILLLVGYVSNNNSFPKPLSQEEESHYLILYEQGDENAKNILIERNLRLVAHIVKKYNNTGRETDDLISIGTIGLIKAINTFDRNKKVRLATYAARCIDNPIITFRNEFAIAQK
ncbi:RNA polymerase sigma-K factor SigK [Gottschalkia acidurici 9a]|uniref:RNA polymerase sigma-K factor SigK n=1 Tax=Gottschalkia acidurici (strain ATCC 7906 / DSM 604 / BCRC 14475 / CIP 104303 / KCTC 5404 / NCIMB 10678 / 9a) TaxID=1128398 RepID=K0AX23_GOTA9|nr:sigma-70 family RNA polymerase sigma factor [Gottschalkia acidurici]AFS78358.1 RNA polymerase sigma-K factor SigK [Gottschalkia acidurici 9a]